MLSKSVVVLCSVIFFAAAKSVPQNTYEDAVSQSSNLLRCWELVDPHVASAGFKLSEPIYPLCTYQPYADLNRFAVGGAPHDSDDYTEVLSVFGTTGNSYAVLSVCLEEAFQMNVPPRPTDVALRCLCKRDGCNIPKPFALYLEFNKSPMPDFHHF